MPASFVHLRLHSAYSLAESTLRIKSLCSLIADDQQPAAAITDTNNMFGALEFAQTLVSAGVQPIMGTQINLKDAQGQGEVVLLAKSDLGYMNLSKLLSKTLLEADAVSDPACSLDDLAAHADDLILLSGGALAGFIGAPAGDGRPALAGSRADQLVSLFGDRFYIELQRHGLGVERAAEPHLLAVADRLNVPLVATNDCRFENVEMSQPHDTLVCIGTGRKFSEADRPRFSPEHYFKNSAQMTELFVDIPEAIANTLVIAKRCSTMAKLHDPILPPFESSDGRNEAEELTAQAEAGLQRRLELHIFTDEMDEAARKAAATPYFDRLSFELTVIKQMGFPGYFLIVADFIQWAKAQNIPVGPGRGSGAGSLVAWALLITDLDPLKWGLLFERFLNPERVSMPDFDIDFCQDRRDEVISYVQNKYGHDKVAQIITFGSLQARAALRDVGRVLEMPYGQVDRIAKLIPNNPAKPTTIAQALVSEEELRQQCRDDEQVADLINVSMKLEGLYRHASTHAAGLVIGDRPLAQLVPLYRDPRSDMPVTQFNMKWVEKAGLVKFDFLGLKTLTVLQRAVEFIGESGVRLDLGAIPLDDKATFEMLSKGDTVGVFQLESSGMRDVLRGLKPDRFEDIIAVVALYRPGPMENIKDYVARKHDPSQITYMHPDLEPVLAETYGIMIYQEQVQQAARVLADYTLGAADILRRAMGKKIKEEMDEQRQIFITGATRRSLSEQLASNIFDQIAAFAGYGFNKSHAAAYALVSYQTAYLKANYPVEFLAASMALDAGNTEKLAVFRQECQQKNITVLPPDINKSLSGFAVEKRTTNGGELALRYALSAVKNVGAEAMSRLTEIRDADGRFASLRDFLQRLPREVINRRQMEGLVRAGALDSIHKNRRELFENMDLILSHADTMRRESESNQVSLFGGDSAVIDDSIRLRETADWAGMDRLKEEFEALGLYLSAHPLDSYANQLGRLRVTSHAELTDQVKTGCAPQRVNLAGSVTSKQVRMSQRGNRFAFVQLTDQTGVFEVTFFSDVLSESSDLLDSEKPLLIAANLKIKDNGPRLLAARVELLDDAIAAWHGGVALWVHDEKPLIGLKEALKADGPGKAEVKIQLNVNGQDVCIGLPGRFKLSGDLREELRRMPGILNVQEL
ncbi:MAG: DNA polymerase III subunit alpha [Candidatus Puniceispirillum sp.]|nr:DNA polymerase III subunit alpha [Candidatus Puniceispirillum sp.]